jgi:hypothetical protein
VIDPPQVRLQVVQAVIGEQDVGHIVAVLQLGQLMHPPQAFLDWLEERGLTLAACTQADLDQWPAGTSAVLARSANFVRWAVSRRHASPPHGPGHALDLPVRAAGPGPPVG